MSRKLMLGIGMIGCLIGVLGCVCEPCDEGRRNKEIAAELVAIINSGDLEKLDQYVAPNYVRHCQSTPDFQVSSLEGLKEFLAADRATVPDSNMVIHRMVAEDDLVAFWATYTGTQDGPMGDFPATGKRMELDFSGMHRIADGKIVETWVIWDNLTALTQLGLYPPEVDEGTPE